MVSRFHEYSYDLLFLRSRIDNMKMKFMNKISLLLLFKQNCFNSNKII